MTERPAAGPSDPSNGGVRSRDAGRPDPGTGGSRPPERRQLVRYAFYKIQPWWRGVKAEDRERAKTDFLNAARSFSGKMLIRSYSLVGTRGDCDFLLWQVAQKLETLQEFATTLASTTLAPYLTLPYSYLAMTRRSIYDIGEGLGDRTLIDPGAGQYLFIYPFVKTRAWYALPMEERQRMMDDHIRVGRKYPRIKLNTTYSYGLDDQEFVVAFEGDDPAEFLDLVMELRESPASMYTLRDWPTFTCVQCNLRETLDSLGGVGQSMRREQAPNEGGMVEVAKVAELPPGARKLIYVGSEAVALFNVNGTLHAIADRCSHARGPLSEGEIDGNTVVCSWHDARFDLATGVPLDPPATMPVAVYPIEVRGDAIFLGPGRVSRGTSAAEIGLASSAAPGADAVDGKPETGVAEGKAGSGTARPRPTADQLASQ